MVWQAVLPAVGSIIGGLGGKRAGDTLAGGYGAAMDFAKAQYEKDRKLFDPYIKAGEGSLEDIAARRDFFNQQFGAQDIYSDPSYRFRLNQGNQATRSAVNAGGGYGGGSTLAALQAYGQNAASQEYQNAYNRFQDTRNQTLGRLLNINKIGQFGVGGAADLGQNLASNIGGWEIGKAGARGAGINSLYQGIGAGIGSLGGIKF